MNKKEEPRIIMTPLWLEAACDQRVAKIKDMVDADYIETFDTIVTTLTEASPGEDIKHWERTCDNCKKHVPENSGDVFYIGTLTRKANDTDVHIMFGMCGDCEQAPR